MHELLTGIIEKTELAVTSARDLVEPATLAGLADTADRARARLDYPDEVLVIALAGGTGSGKSSLFNVLIGDDVSPVGALRPTTSEPLAAVPKQWAAPLAGHLDRLGIDRRVVTDVFGHCLIDLPDTDSVVVDHRHRVEEVIPHVDVVIWVVDPEKYRDSALHHRYLAPLAGYGEQFIVVLNQVDRLEAGEVAEVVADLRAALTEDGIGSPHVAWLAAAPPSGPPVGVDELRGLIAGLTKSTLFGKLMVDMGSAARDLITGLGPPVDYRSRLDAVVDQVARSLAADDPGGASATLTELFETIAAETGGMAGKQLMDFSVTMPAQLAEIARSLPMPAVPTWWQRLTGANPLPPDRLTPAMRALEDLLAPVTRLMTDRARALALATELSLTVL